MCELRWEYCLNDVQEYSGVELPAQSVVFVCVPLSLLFSSSLNSRTGIFSLISQSLSLSLILLTFAHCVCGSAKPTRCAICPSLSLLRISGNFPQESYYWRIFFCVQTIVCFRSYFPLLPLISCLINICISYRYTFYTLSPDSQPWKWNSVREWIHYHLRTAQWWVNMYNFPIPTMLDRHSFTALAVTSWSILRINNLLSFHRPASCQTETETTHFQLARMFPCSMKKTKMRIRFMPTSSPILCP